MSESGGMSINCLTAGGQNVATDVKGNITMLPANLCPAGTITAMNLTWDSYNKLRSADNDAIGRRVAQTGTEGSVVYVQMDQQTIADYPVDLGCVWLTPHASSLKLDQPLHVYSP